MGTSLLDDGWSSGRKNFTQLESDNYVTPGTSSVGERTRSGWRGSPSSQVMDGAARGLDLLGVINDLAQMKGDIEATANEMAAKRVADQVEKQLAPDQRATLLINRETGETRLLHAGEGYLYGPSDKPFAYELKGDDGGVCRGNEVPDTRSFDVIDRDGQHRKLEFEEHWKPEFEDKQNKQKEDKDRDRDDRRLGGHVGQSEEEA